MDALKKLWSSKKKKAFKGEGHVLGNAPPKPQVHKYVLLPITGLWSHFSMLDRVRNSARKI